METLTVEEKMVQARSLLVLDHCFWGVLALKLKMAPSELTGTAATNGEMLLYNPEYITGLSNAETKGLLAHEVGHCAMGHIWRATGRDPKIANMAMDYVLNSELIESGFTLPEGALLNDSYKGKCFEDVYDILYAQALPSGEDKGKDESQGGEGQKGKGKSKSQPGDQPGQDDGSENDSEDGQDPQEYPDPGKCGGVYAPEQGKEEESKSDWRASVAQAVQISQGRLPASLQKLLDIEVLNPVLPWYVLLRDFVERTARNDYNWNNPNRRYLSRGIVLPGLISEELPHVVVVVDSSGSTYQYQEQFAAEASGVLGSYKTRITLIYCDACVQSVQEYSTEDLPLKIEAKGYGGTDFRPPFDYIEKEGLSPACIIYLTDLYGTFPEEEPMFPVLWVSVVPEMKAPWGETVPMKVH